MSAASARNALGAEKYVSLITFRRDGTPVATPVWMVADGDHLLVVTTAAAGKVKRLAHTPRVLMRPCDGRGRVADGAPAWEGSAVVVTSAPAVARLRTLLVDKYGLMARAFILLGKVRGRSAQEVRLEITPAS